MFFIALASDSAVAMPEPLWIKLLEDARRAISIDANNIGRTGDVVSAWVTTSWNAQHQAGKFQFRSTVDNYKFNCQAQSALQVQFTMFTGPDRQGSVVGTLRNPDAAAAFEPVLPGSVNAALLNFACAAARR